MENQSVTQLSTFPAISVVLVYAGFLIGSSFLRYHYSFDVARDFLESHGGFYSEETFDFIIVGSGSSGSVLGSRLSKRFKVLMLEAGGRPNALHSLPILTVPLLGHPELDWMYKTVPQKKACLALNSQQSFWPRGKVLGGSSNLNAMIYLRGHPKDFDNWANELEDPIWKYRSIINYYKNFEDFDDNNPNHGHGGEQIVEHVERGELVDAFVRSGTEFGYPEVDLNFYHAEGFAPLTFTRKKGERWENYKTFIKTAQDLNSERLTIYSYATVHKVLFDNNRKAIGVEYKRHGYTRRVYCTKEVILSAGAINSPKILMHSGIGPRAHLEQIGIPVIMDLPVGQNLQDHVGTLFGMFSVNQPITTSVQNSLNYKSFYDYFTTGTGPLSNSFTTGVASIASAVNINANYNTSLNGKWPDYQLTLIGASHPSYYKPFLDKININKEILGDFYDATADANTFQFYIINARPHQRGEIWLGGPDFDTPPLIDPKYLQNKKDVDVLVEAMRFSSNLVTKTNAFRRLGGKYLGVPLPACSKLKFGSDAYYECYLRHLTLTLFHPCCTCRMGGPRDRNRVSNSKFEVIGVENLRVIDASSFPIIPTSNLNAAANLVGEMGADMICKRWIGKSCYPFRRHTP